MKQVQYLKLSPLWGLVVILVWRAKLVAEAAAGALGSVSRSHSSRSWLRLDGGSWVWVECLRFAEVGVEPETRELEAHGPKALEGTTQYKQPSRSSEVLS